jgi:prepilin-type N-terminal cleavage/methylation domain-containing protein
MKILNFKFKASSSRGYTLVEMLAVIVVFSIIGGIISAIFASSLRGSNKANITNEVRQNGNYALIQMSRMITYARSFDGISEDGISYKADCYVDMVGLDTTTTIPTAYHYVKVSDFQGGQTIFACNGQGQSEISSNSASLINNQIVKVDSCQFSCSQPSIAASPTIKISFTLSQKSDTNFFESKANIPFETTMSMRNTGRQ